MNRIELTQDEKKHILEKFIECFKTGQEFEKFLGVLLQKLEFEEVVVTQPVKDWGIDLTAMRKGFDISGSDTNNYYFQAKRNKLNHKVDRDEISKLRGTVKKDKNGNILSNQIICIFITTSTFTKPAEIEAKEDVNRPIILIDGYTLIDLCIQHGIGFDFKPVFDAEDVKNIVLPKQANNVDDAISKAYDVEKVVTANDIRARILRLPLLVKNIIPNNQETLALLINGKNYSLTIDKTKCYLAGVTDLYRILGMIRDDGTLHSKTSKWAIDNDRISVVIE